MPPTQGLTKYYGKTCVLKGTTYGVRYSDCFGLVGASGAGKTTTFAIITGSTLPNSGLAILGNRPVHGNAIVGYCPQFDSLLGCLSAFQNMEIVAGLVGQLRRFSYTPSISLSYTISLEHCCTYVCGGQKRRISVGVAMLSLSPCLILDEPTAGIDPEARRDVWKLLDGELDEGRSLLLSSHSMEECEAHCSRIGVLCRGRLIAIGDSQTLKNRFKILEPCFFSSFCFNSG
ncbi:unnamed protein product [Heligmosomoides polygyrus]|uniref:ABC transporter domain-containing protein n=1 Tax=Heligmosomoides polygyrus TaxID=6339 RepID=A0A183GCM1_HELPZ|nr:unnamed protein product [Heligmosomoides polygyrus]